MRFKKIFIVISISFSLFSPANVFAFEGGTGPALLKTNDCANDVDCKDENKYCSEATEKIGRKCLNKKPVGSECKNDNECQSNSCQTMAGGKEKKCVNPATGEGTLKIQPFAPKPEVDIPTLQPFTTSGMQKADEEGFIYVPFIGQYIAAIFRWALLVAGIVAVVLVIWGGFVYLTSGGNASRTSEGKDRITHAILGLIILLGSYTLLYIIDPDLVRFKSLRIQVVERVELADNPEKMKDPAEAPPCTGPNNPSKPSGIGDTKYLGQLDNFACGTRELNQIKFIVLHEGGRNTAATVEIFKKRSVSSHYSIDRDGKIFQLVGEERRAWHAGAINAYSIGIDLAIAPECPISGKSTKCVYTEEQINALKTLISNITSRLSGLGGDNSVIAHCQVGGTDHTDTRNFDWSKIGLNNSAHYENPGDLTSKCKIVFNLEEYKKTQPATGKPSSPTGCCYQAKMGAFEGTQNQCSLGTFYAGSCSDQICCGLAGTMAAKECLGKGLSVTGSGACQ